MDRALSQVAAGLVSEASANSVIVQLLDYIDGLINETTSLSPANRAALAEEAEVSEPKNKPAKKKKTSSKKEGA